VSGMIANGIPPQIAQQIWELFPPFARYGFNKSHAACYAVIGYRTAYLKAHYREEFTAGLLNAEVNDIDRISVLVQEAKQTGVEILPPDINKSFVNFTPDGNKIRFGLVAIKNVGAEITRGIIEERIKKGQFNTFEEFLTRVQHKDLNKKSLESLAKGGAFDSLGIERNQAIMNIDDIVKFAASARKDPSLTSGASSLFGASAPKISLRLKPAPPATDQQKLLWEKELLGFYLSDHPMNSYSEKLKTIRPTSIEKVRLVKDEATPQRTAGLITQIKKIITKKGDPMIFATIEDALTQQLEILVFNSVLTKTASIWEENKVILVSGRMSWRDGEPKMICDDARKLEA